MSKVEGLSPNIRKTQRNSGPPMTASLEQTQTIFKCRRFRKHILEKKNIYSYLSSVIRVFSLNLASVDTLVNFIHVHAVH